MSLLKSHRQVSSVSSPNLKAGPSASSSNTSLNKTYKRPHFFRRLFGGGGYNNTNNNTTTPIPTIAEATTVSLVKDSIATEVTQENSTINSTSDLAYTVSVWLFFFFFFFFPFLSVLLDAKNLFLKTACFIWLCLHPSFLFFLFFFFFFLFLFFLLHVWFLTLDRKRTAFQVQRNCYLSLRFFKVSFLQA